MTKYIYDLMDFSRALFGLVLMWSMAIIFMLLIISLLGVVLIGLYKFAKEQLKE